MVGVEDLVVVGRGERVRVAGAEGEVTLQVGFESNERQPSEKLSFAVLAHDGYEVSEAAALAVGGAEGQLRVGGGSGKTHVSS